MGSRVYIALGSNMGNREENLSRGIALLNDLPGTRVLKQSKVYETDPVGYTEQGPFLNMVVSLDTEHPPLTLLDYLQDIEKQMKRVREIHWGPRTLDVDILLIEGVGMEDVRLTIPHPRMFQRAFVLVPLRDVYPDPAVGSVNIEDCINECSDKEGIRHFADVLL